jgi:ABC-type nitrate/sulfonate/bicarbonate transport system substrate-binding protein
MRDQRTRRVGIFVVLQLIWEVSIAQQVTFNLFWLPQGSISGVIVAIELGYYAELGFDAKAVRGYEGNRL